ncbi:hypothetical protein HY490_05540 [Candidatus Woesearchaeota archaeon]|nr:hypothetical protein [Candidatus Woesearchaeota archaeon]
MDTVTLVQFNMNQAYGLENFLWPKWPRMLGEITDELNKLPRPRVVGLDEIARRERKSGFNLIEKIQQEAGFAYGTYASNYRVPGYFDVGNALFSDYPLTDINIGTLKGGFVWGRLHNALFGPRTYILAKVTHPHGSFYTIVAHLGVKDAPHKVASARLLSRISSRITGPVVLLVDANAIPIYSVKRKDFADGDITNDDYTRCRTMQFLRLGYPQDLCPVGCYDPAQAEDPDYWTFRGTRRIDYILGNNLPRPLDYTVVQQILSDHAMTICTLPLPQQSAERKDITDLVRPPNETIPYHIVNAVTTLSALPAGVPAAAQAAYASAKQKLSGPAKKISARFKAFL